MALNKVIPEAATILQNNCDNSFVKFTGKQWYVIESFIVEAAGCSPISLLIKDSIVCVFLKFCKVFESSLLTHFQPFFHIYTPWKQQEKLRFSDAFRWYISETLAENGLIEHPRAANFVTHCVHYARIPENTGQRKPIFSLILPSHSYSKSFKPQ